MGRLVVFNYHRGADPFFEKLRVLQPVKKFFSSCGTGRFITVFTTARHLTLSWHISVQSTPFQPMSLRSSYPTTYTQFFQVASFPQGLPTKNLYSRLLSPIHSTCPAHLFRLGLMTWGFIGWGAQIMKFIIVQTSPLSCYLVLLRSKYLPQHHILEHLLPVFLPLTSLLTYNLSVTRMTSCFVYYFTFFFHARIVTSRISVYRATNVFFF